MNKGYLLALSLGVLTATPAFCADLPWEMKLPFKEATIHYELSGSQQGQETLYIKDSGKLRARYHKASATMMGVTTSNDTVEFIDPDWIYSYDLVAKTGAKSTNPAKIYQAEYTKLSATEKKNFEKNAQEFGAGMMSQFGGSVTRSSGQVLGYDCEVITVNNGMSTVYQLRGSDLPLRSDVAVMGMKNSTVATKIDTSTAIPAAAFTHPAGITAVHNTEADSMMTSTIQGMVQSLKDPDGAKKMQQGGAATMMAPAMQQAMEEDGMSKEEQQEMMRQMQEAMQQMQKKQR